MGGRHSRFPRGARGRAASRVEPWRKSGASRLLRARPRDDYPREIVPVQPPSGGGAERGRGEGMYTHGLITTREFSRPIPGDPDCRRSRREKEGAEGGRAKMRVSKSGDATLLFTRGRKAAIARR